MTRKKINLKGYYEGNQYQSIIQEMVTDEEVIDEQDIDSAIHRKQSYHRLSTEAKEVVNLVIQTPAELIGVITTPKGRKTKALLVKYLKRKWKSDFLVNHVIKEITNWVRSW